MAGYREFLTGEVLSAANVNNFLMNQVVMVFADDSARTAALAGVLAEGMLTYNLDTRTLEVYDGTAFITPPLNAPEKVVTANTTLALPDRGHVIAFDSASNLTLTVPTNATVEFPIGTIINVYRAGTGTVGIEGAVGVTVRNTGSISDQFGEVSLRKRDTNEWVLVGEVDEP